ncbi:MAG: hypothetical protein ACE5HI_15715 [bacterium]
MNSDLESKKTRRVRVRVTTVGELLQIKKMLIDCKKSNLKGGVLNHIKILTIAALLSSGNLIACDGKISGYMFGDYYWVAALPRRALCGRK